MNQQTLIRIPNPSGGFKFISLSAAESWMLDDKRCSLILPGRAGYVQGEIPLYLANLPELESVLRMADLAAAARAGATPEQAAKLVRRKSQDRLDSKHPNAIRARARSQLFVLQQEIADLVEPLAGTVRAVKVQEVSSGQVRAIFAANGRIFSLRIHSKGVSYRPIEGPSKRSKKRVDSFARLCDRADGGVRLDRGAPSSGIKKKAGRKLPTCGAVTYNCGAICIGVRRTCHLGGVNVDQARLRKVRRIAARLGADQDFQQLIGGIKSRITQRTGEKRERLLKARVQKLRGKLRDRALESSGKPGSIGELSPDAIAVDPKRFQFKLIGEHTATGEVGSLSGVKRYDPNLAGIIQVWRDPKDGKDYVVNGHNRLALASRANADRVTVRWLDVKNAAEARAVGALTNIAEGRGTALDAAKFFRDTGISRDDLERKGIPMREKVANDGLSIANLDNSLFRQAIDGKLPIERASRIGGSGLETTEQRALVDLLNKQEKRGRRINNDVMSELIDTVKSSANKTETQFTLFGAETTQQNLAIEKASLQASIKRRLSREKKLFGTVGKSQAAKELERGGNQIDVEQSKNLSQQASNVLGIFDKLKNVSGPVADKLNTAAERISNGENRKAVERDIYREIVEDLPALVGIGKRKSA